MNELELKKEVVTVTDQINAMVVNSPESYTEAGRAIIGMNDLVKKIKEYWKPLKEKAFQVHKEITGKENEMLKPVEDRRKELAKRVSAYLTEQERIKQDEQRKRDEEIRAQIERERAKLEKKAEKAEVKGDTDKAEALREQAADVYVPPVIVQGAVDKTTRTEEGTISTVKDIEVTITDPVEILKGIIAGHIPIAVITINESKLKAHCKSFGIKQLPGCVINEIVKSQFRGAK